MCQLLKLGEKKMHQHHLRTKSNHLQQTRLCTCLFSQDFDSTFRFWDIICWPSPLGLPTVYDATISQLSWVLPTVSLTKDTTAGTSGSNTKRSPDCQTLPGSRPSLYSSPQPPTCKESTRSISQHSCQHLIFYVKLYLTIILNYISLKSIFLLLHQPYRFFLGDCLNLAIHQ